MPSDVIEHFVFANTLQTFRIWGQERALGSLSHGVFQRYNHEDNQVHSYRHVKTTRYLMGVNRNGSIILLYGWDDNHRDEKITEFTRLSVCGVHVEGEREYISDEDWLTFSRAKNLWILRERKISLDQSWLFDNIDNRFEVMEV